MAQHRVTIKGQNVTITAFEKATSEWVATGTIFDQRVEVVGPTEAAAVFVWKTRATYMKGEPG